MKVSHRLERHRRWLAGTAILLPLSILIWFTWQHAILVPFNDEFNLVPLIHKMNAGTLTFADVMAQHNEHRPFFPNLLLLGMAKISHWTIAWEIVADLILAGLIFTLILRLVWRTFPERPVTRWGLAVGFSWLVFSPNQYENWIWGWELEWFLCMLGVLVTVTILSSEQPLSKTRLGIAAVAATVADYSLAAGVLAWVAGLIILFCRGEKPAWKWAWTVIGVLIATPYYYHYHGTSPAQGSVTYALEHPVAFVGYVLMYLGNPLSTSHRAVTTQIAAALSGTALLGAFLASCCYVWLRYREAIPRLAPWIALGVFAVVSAALTAVGRLKLGTVQALSSRYITATLVFLLATIVVTLVVLQRALSDRPRLLRNAIAVPVSLLAILVLIGYPAGFVLGRRWPDVADYQHCVHTAQSASTSCLRVAYPESSGYAFQQIRYLRQIHWAGF
ncbi:MAG TPA: hypothetical protein VK730_04005 [Solirubrobacteraceae bacterium]|jgi:hypothetical protein|nr:hypothetical protein [Solirubrobacteraceae bacterium]